LNLKKVKKPSSQTMVHETFEWVKKTFSIEVKKVQNAYIDFDLDVPLSDMKVLHEISLHEVPNLKFHGKKKSPRLVYGTIGSKHVLAILGVAYTHEYPSCVDLTLLVRCFYLLGVSNIYMSASMVRVSEKLNKNAIVLVRDHINFTGRNPLIGHNLDEFGPVFPEMSSVHGHIIGQEVLEIAQKNGIDIQKTGLFQTSGGMLYSKMDHEAASKFNCGVVNSFGIAEIIIAGHSSMKVCYIGAVDKADVKSVEKIIDALLSK
jgi:purine nucleoside phosphorylase